MPQPWSDQTVNAVFSAVGGGWHEVHGEGGRGGVLGSGSLSVGDGGSDAWRLHGDDTFKQPGNV